MTEDEGFGWFSLVKREVRVTILVSQHHLQFLNLRSVTLVHGSRFPDRPYLIYKTNVGFIFVNNGNTLPVRSLGLKRKR